MATRSTIALEFADGTVQQVYAHWDGYLDHNGKILLNDYADPFKLRDLIDLGDISSLDSDIDSTVFYMRDRGETGCEARKFKDYAEFRREAQGEEYNYILRKDGNWYVEFYGEFDGLLTEAFKSQKEEA